MKSRTVRIYLHDLVLV